MAVRSAMATAVSLTTSMEALAALAAHVRIETEGIDAGPQVREALAAIASELLGGDAPIDDGARAVVGMAQSLLRQAIAMVDDPRPVGPWSPPDEQVLQGIGRLSMAIVSAFRVAEGVLDGLGERLDRDGASFLDVGAGTGWLAIAIARAYPRVRVVGIDIFEPALALARRNIAAEITDGRVELRSQDVMTLDEVDTFDAVWLPLPFLPEPVVPRALAAAHRALRTGGWVLPGTFAGSDDRLSQLLVDLRTVRSGGYPWRSEEIVAAVTAAGFVGVTEVARSWVAPVGLYAGQRP